MGRTSSVIHPLPTLDAPTSPNSTPFNNSPPTIIPPNLSPKKKDITREEWIATSTHYDTAMYSHLSTGSPRTLKCKEMIYDVVRLPEMEDKEERLSQLRIISQDEAGRISARKAFMEEPQGLAFLITEVVALLSEHNNFRSVDDITEIISMVGDSFLLDHAGPSLITQGVPTLILECLCGMLARCETLFTCRDFAEKPRIHLCHSPPSTSVEEVDDGTTELLPGIWHLLHLVMELLKLQIFREKFLAVPRSLPVLQQSALLLVFANFPKSIHTAKLLGDLMRTPSKLFLRSNDVFSLLGALQSRRVPLVCAASLFVLPLLQNLPYGRKADMARDSLLRFHMQFHLINGLSVLIWELTLCPDTDKSVDNEILQLSCLSILKAIQCLVPRAQLPSFLMEVHQPIRLGLLALCESCLKHNSLLSSPSIPIIIEIVRILNSLQNKKSPNVEGLLEAVRILNGCSRANENTWQSLLPEVVQALSGTAPSESSMSSSVAASVSPRVWALNPFSRSSTPRRSSTTDETSTISPRKLVVSQRSQSIMDSLSTFLGSPRTSPRRPTLASGSISPRHTNSQGLTATDSYCQSETSPKSPRSPRSPSTVSGSPHNINHQNSPNMSNVMTVAD